MERAPLTAGTGWVNPSLFWANHEYHICPSEGGHTDFAPNNDLEIDLLRYLQPAISMSVMSASYRSGLHLIYQFLRDTKNTSPPGLPKNSPPAIPQP